jgi:Predicted glycosylase
MHWLAESNYEIHFAPSSEMSERIIFPVSPNESNGIEDARFRSFCRRRWERYLLRDLHGLQWSSILPQLIETEDFLNFRVLTLNGPAVQNKGMALFPRRIDGRYVMLSRQDDENLYLTFSDDPHFWSDPLLLQEPQQPWEFVKLGNCGSPIETEAGWLVLTHGVGPMRKYCIGATLLDLHDPARIIGHLKEPLLRPEGNEREGYVPNVVYSCGHSSTTGNSSCLMALAIRLRALSE